MYVRTYINPWEKGAKACTQFGYLIHTKLNYPYYGLSNRACGGERLNEKEFELEPTELSLDWQPSTYIHVLVPSLVLNARHLHNL